MIQHNKKSSGFTLVELMIVITIIGILSMVAIPAYLGHRERAVHAEAKSNLQALYLLQEAAFADNGNYGTASTTYNYKAGDITIQTLRPGFKPGAPATLNFDYELVVGNPATTFTATAVGKSSSIVYGATFSIDNLNSRSGF